MNELTPLRMTVLGSGSVGLAVAASFAQAGQSATLLARGTAVPLLREQGITVTGVCGDHRVEPSRLRVCDADEPAAQDIACDVLIVATKAYQVAQVLKRLMRNAGKPSRRRPFSCCRTVGARPTRRVPPCRSTCRCSRAS